MRLRLAVVALLFAGGASAATAQTDRLDFPGLFGLGFPGYDRANGLSVPVSASFAVNSRITLDPRVTYRSQLGRIDPWLDVIDSVGSAGALSIEGGCPLSAKADIPRHPLLGYCSEITGTSRLES